MHLPRRTVIFGFLAFLLAACGEDLTNVGSNDVPVGDPFCTIPQDDIYNATGKDAIPALTNPDFVGIGEAGSDYLRNDDRVIGFLDGSQALAIPLNIMWYHEIVNLKLNGALVSITHCPLTGSTIGFTRKAALDSEFGVSGLLYNNNLVMYDRRDRESLWPQMAGGARCGDLTGTELTMVPLIEMSWEGWQALHPGTKLVSAFTGYSRPYDQYPYPSYDIPENPSVLFPMQVDTRRPPKERVLGIPVYPGGIAFPYGALDEKGPVFATHLEFNGKPIVVFWDRSVQGAAVFRTQLDDQELTFRVSGGKIVDDQTGSSWRVDGFAAEGALAGARLELLPEGFVAFWFAWPAFYPKIQIWG
jgi:hypothetical protein